MSVYFPFRPFSAFVFVCFPPFSSSKLLHPIRLSSDEKTFNAFLKITFDVDCWHTHFVTLLISYFPLVCRAHGNGLNTVSASSMLNTGNNHHVLTPVPGDPSGRLVMTLLPSQGGGAGHDMMMHGGNGGGTMGLHGLHEQHHSGASSSSHSTRYNQGTVLHLAPRHEI